MMEQAVADAIERLRAEDAVGQLRRRDGQMAALGSEDGALKLDWVSAVARMLADPVALEKVESEARAIRAQGIRHIIWAGMGGSVLTVRVLRELGFGGSDGQGQAIAIYPLDSTDPRALNEIVRAIATVKHLPLPPGQDTALPRELLADVLMVGVALGMTSEEPITHLAWFTDLLGQAELSPAEHLLVMSLPGSYLDTFAQEHDAPRRPLQLDGGAGTGGRMSAPGTRVFLLPAALYLTGKSDAPGQLRAVLQRAWESYDLDGAATHPETHPYVRLAATMSAASVDGVVRLLIQMPPGWEVFVSWLEQLMEESLGKGGKGVVVFGRQTLNEAAPGFSRQATLRVDVVAETVERENDGAPITEDNGPTFTLPQPLLASADAHERLVALVAGFLGWQLAMALYGYLQGIQFAGQPAVENYKARARALRQQADPLAVAMTWPPAAHDSPLVLLAPADALPNETPIQTPAAVFARMLREATAREAGLGYLDVTLNGEGSAELRALLVEHAHRIGNTLLGVPVKLRQAPAAYHSTEQSEMDGPSNLVSLRIVARAAEAALLGSYTPTFLHAQAVSTWQAMLEVERPCCLLVLDGTLDDALDPLVAFFATVEALLRTD